MSNLSRLGAVGAVAMALAGSVAPALHYAPRPQTVVSNKRKRGLFNGAVLPFSGMLIGSRATRNTVARDKRAALKRRCQLRHKRACRG
jgi:hypothetical protein